MIQGETVLITGGAGSFGQAFTRYCLDAGAGKVIVFSRGEHRQAAMREEFGCDRVRYVVGDVRDPISLNRAMGGVTVCIHAAALKRVEVGEYCPSEVVRTNVEGTNNVINTCLDCGVERGVFISSDKACHPHNLYGSTKSVGEGLWVGANVYDSTLFSCVRYGNVWGSQGSIVERWSRGPLDTVTVTHKDMTRFIITLPQACALVSDTLHTMRGGEVFIPRLPSVLITDVAAALQPNAWVQFIGIRPGEKMHEQLVSTEEAACTTRSSTGYVIYPTIELPTGRANAKEEPVGVKPYTSVDNDRWLSITEIKELSC